MSGFLLGLAKFLRQLVALLISLRTPHAQRLVFLSLNGTPMSDFILPSAKIATIPVLALDQNGAPIALPGPLSVTSSDSSVGSAVVGADGVTVVLTPAGVDGTFSVTATSGTLSATLVVDVNDVVVQPVATSLSFDTANATFADKTA